MPAPVLPKLSFQFAASMLYLPIRPSTEPGMGAILELQVLRRADHSERSEAQLREGDRAWEGSVERKP